MACVLALSACSSNTPSTGQTSSGGASQSTAGPTQTATATAPSGATTITFWNGFTGPDGDALKARVAAFNASQSKYFVDMQIMPWDVLGQKLMPALGAHQGPNITVSGIESVGQYATNGAFAPLDDFYSAWADQGAMFPRLIAATSWEGKHYSVPMTFSPCVVYYNKALFTAAGLDPNKPPVTWQEFADAAVALTKDTNNDGKPEQYGFVLPDHTSPAIWESMMWGNGGGTISDDGKTPTIGNKESIDAVTYWNDLLQQKHISPAGISGPDADALFQSGKVGMLSEGPWMINGFKDAGIDFGVANVPTGSAGAFPVANSNEFFVSNDTMKDAAQKEAVYAFFTFWNTKDNQIAWAVTSGNPPTRNDITPQDLSANAPMAEFTKYQSTAKPFLANTANFGRINSEIYEASMQKITGGKGTPQDVMTAAAPALQAILDGK